MSLAWLLGLYLSFVGATLELGPYRAVLPIQPVRVPVYQALAAEIETKDFTEAMPFKQFAQLVYEKLAVQWMEVSFIVDLKSFYVPPDSGAGVYDDEVKLPPVPRRLTVAQALDVAMHQLRNEGAYLVRNGSIYITTRKNAGVEVRLREHVVSRFDGVPLADVVRRLSDLNGLTILIDPRAKEKAQAPITAEFRGDITLGAALSAITDMADLRVVNLDNCLYVTTQANADALEKRMRERRDEKPRDNERRAQPSREI